jgi:hypothetical protein
MMTASRVWPPANVTLITPAPPAAASITWLLAMIVASERRITPDPSPVPPTVVTVIVTTLGKAAAAALASCWLGTVAVFWLAGGAEAVTVVTGRA